MPRPVLRPAREADFSTLERHALATSDARWFFVLERDGVIAGAVAVRENPFESDILKRRVAQIEALRAWETSDDLPRLAAGAIEALAASGIAFASCRLSEDDGETISALEHSGMAIVERLMTFAHPLRDAAGPVEPDTTQPTEADADACAAVAARAFRFDRFHADPKIDDALADALKAAWIRNSVLGRADRVLVHRESARIVAFNACMLRDGDAVIDLIGVDPDHQGRGIGRRLTQAALTHYAGRASRMVVGTQTANETSLSLYRRAGFLHERTAVTLHAHLQ